MTTEQEIRMFGCTIAELKSETDAALDRGARPTSLVRSLLSDAQECIYLGNSDQARQVINRVKYITLTYMENV